MTTAFLPPVGRCVFCVYETRFEGSTDPQTRARLTVQLANVPVATRTIETPNGPREVCEHHAATKTWKR
jgi:hypothetical protein